MLNRFQRREKYIFNHERVSNEEDTEYILKSWSGQKPVIVEENCCHVTSLDSEVLSRHRILCSRRSHNTAQLYAIQRPIHTVRNVGRHERNTGSTTR